MEIDMTKAEEIIDNIARLNSQTWRDREEVRMEIGKLLSELKQALEQQLSEDEITITMKKGTLKYSGQGYVVYKKDWFRKHFAMEVAIMTGYDGYIEQPTSDDCVSRKDVLEMFGYETTIYDLPPVTPTHGTCKDCKHWKDSDGVYRRGAGAESKCPINIKEVYEGNFYCKDFDKRGNSDDSN